jgi:hypothetical protein
VTPNVFTDHTQAIRFNTVTTLTRIVYMKNLHPQNLPLYKGTPGILQSIQCSTVTLTVQNIATLTAALDGQNSDPIQLKQSVDRNIAVFSGNQV